MNNVINVWEAGLHFGNFRPVEGRSWLESRQRKRKKRSSQGGWPNSTVDSGEAPKAVLAERGHASKMAKMCEIGGYGNMYVIYVYCSAYIYIYIYIFTYIYILSYVLSTQTVICIGSLLYNMSIAVRVHAACENLIVVNTMNKTDDVMLWYTKKTKQAKHN